MKILLKDILNKIKMLLNILKIFFGQKNNNFVKMFCKYFLKIVKMYFDILKSFFSKQYFFIKIYSIHILKRFFNHFLKLFFSTSQKKFLLKFLIYVLKQDTSKCVLLYMFVSTNLKLKINLFKLCTEQKPF